MENLLRKIDLVSLRLFAAVCQEKNIARAAESQFIAPSAVSRRIAEIEALVGMPLIQRHARGITITPAGEVVRRGALTIASSIDAMSAELSRLRSGTTGKVRIVANLSSIVQFLPEDIAAFERLFPSVRIEIEDQSSTDTLRTLSKRSADFGICTMVSGIDQFECVPYRTDQLSVMVPKHHRLAGVDHLSFPDLLNESFIGLGSETALMQLLERECAALGTALHTKIRASTLEAMCRLVHVGLGIAIVPKNVGALYLNSLDVMLRPLLEPWASRQFFLISHGRAQLNASASALVDFLLQPEFTN